MKIMTTICAIALASLACSLPAKAETKTTYIQGWEIMEEDEGCVMKMVYEGQGATSFIYVKTLELDSAFFVSNYNWTPQDGEFYKITFDVDGDYYQGRGMGSYLDGRNGIFGEMIPQFEKSLIKGDYIHIYLENTLIDKLTLGGSASAIAAVNTCYERLLKVEVNRKKVEEERKKEEERWKHLPLNPFAKNEDDQ